jgi:hypothetical protein
VWDVLTAAMVHERILTLSLVSSHKTPKWYPAQKDGVYMYVCVCSRAFVYVCVHVCVCVCVCVCMCAISISAKACNMQFTLKNP